MEETSFAKGKGGEKEEVADEPCVGVCYFRKVMAAKETARRQKEQEKDERREAERAALMQEEREEDRARGRDSINRVRNLDHGAGGEGTGT